LLVDLAERVAFRVAAVLPAIALTGSAAAQIARSARPVELQAPPADDPDSSGVRFLHALLERRLGLPSPEWPAGFRPVALDAAVMSGGLPRLFLQLVQQAVDHAARRGEAWPRPDDLDRAL